MLNDKWSKIAENDVEKERAVILQEVQESQFNLQEMAIEHLHKVAFQGTPLGQTVVGPTKNIMGLTRDDLIHYRNTHFKGPRMVLAGAGGVNHEELAQLAQTHFTKITKDYEGEIPINRPCRYSGKSCCIINSENVVT